MRKIYGWGTKRLAPAAIFLFLFASGNAAAQSVGLTENPGAQIPADIKCLDEKGGEFALASQLDRPVILALVYYACEHICPEVLMGLGKLVSELELRPAVDYRVIALSFDPDDTPQAAATARKNYVRPLGPGFPESGWTFATATPENIARLTGALGFRYERRDHGFIHPSILVILGPGGLVSGYVHVRKFEYGMSYPVAFSAAAMKQSLLEAGRGSVFPSSRTPLLYCFPEEPPGQTRYFRLASLMGWITLAGLALLFAALSLARSRAREE